MNIIKWSAVNNSSWCKFLWAIFASASLLLTGCGVFQGRDDLYVAYFSPDEEVLNICKEATVVAARDIESIIRYRRSRIICPSYKNETSIPIDSGIGPSPAWGRYDGGGTIFSVNSLTEKKRALEDERERARLEKLSERSVPIESSFLGDFHSHGLKWEVQEKKYFFDRGDVTAKSDDRYFRVDHAGRALGRYEVTYIYRSPAGWWLTVNGSFDGRMLSYPDVLASRLATLRTIAESVELQPMNAANIECSYQKKAKREICRYRIAH
ncbi:hypothetical protein [Xanthomonas vesicatoria]|nr:hypothetical protein [Xanthomonas vesicatoria]APP73986.1 hypothetical protein BJD12_00495 [Xanthomonas vesicatoria ATCC 35937]EGD07132.1 hypothetical protein XVE_4679 [Xanthomonas vesicatoria ATCC 35937]EGD07230.1 hypothetical protein XVE_4579 [Xanthomonas vesicatoria ATCC 35937]MCC8559863.1 hypothetical protein [Xanthomonas vesicatoria]MCC8600089.1 hypothetical protein [Xanthomonas vesicatoria]